MLMNGRKQMQKLKLRQIRTFCETHGVFLLASGLYVQLKPHGCVVSRTETTSISLMRQIESAGLMLQLF